ncbi:agmatinase [Thermovibrio ammonificans]|uniref:Agmatinase n=1 Tax=Thermovibrio ammonificans (strain DSM 15698 / JCM 12110 / HB-1) TaxID=648996 RepID=E8T4C8_THEA1|nr:agmatinase [Thermovibrio ammonificans]ADU96263.1 agmatinase [Thermovibrio ammonificans HB-1]
MKFLCAKEKGKIAVVGAPYDSTTCFRPGARFGPDGIRNFSHNLEEFSPALNKTLEELQFCDLGNVELPAPPEQMVEHLYSFVKEVELPVVLGGEHSVTYPVVKALKERYGSLTVIHFDAHADLRDEYSGTPYSHACVMRRVAELGCTVYQVGIRSGAREEFLYRETSPFVFDVELSELPTLFSSLEEPVYITVDIDYFDPAYAPGTGTPEPGGASPLEFFTTLYKLPAVKLVGFDLVEVAPPYDPSGITQALGAKVVREVMLKFWG